VASAASSGALDEGRGAEILQARSRGGQRLAAAFSASRSVLKRRKVRTFGNELIYHCETVSDPQALPVVRALGDVHILAVDGHHVGLNLADHAPRDVFLDGVVRHGHHGDGRVGAQPVALVVPAGVVADVVEVAEEERHRAETVHARARHA